MFLRILYFVVSAAVVGVAVNRLYSVVQFLTIIPSVCKYSTRHSQRYLIHSGRGYFEEPVSAAVASENYVRTRAFIMIDIAIAIALGLLIPSSWSFWIVPPWAIKIGCILAILVMAWVDFITSANTDSRVGFLESIDELGKCHFRGDWMKDFVVDVGGFWKKEDYPPIGHNYIVLDYYGFFCTAPLDAQVD